MIKRIYQKFSHPLRGITYALLHDRGYQLQFVSGGISLALFSYFFAPFTQSEILFLGLAWVLILTTELQNSSFEAALDRLHPELHESIKRSKDMAAGAVLTSGFFLLFVMAMIVFF
jgi:diacylglycerol kinase